jgi:ornithine carbamoyltransferase
LLGLGMEISKFSISVITSHVLPICHIILLLNHVHQIFDSVLHDLMLGCAKLGMNVRIATPKGYECNSDIMSKTEALAKENGTENVFVTNVADEAVQGSDVIVTDTWVSMGQEDEYEKRVKEFAGYEVNTDLMNRANDGAVFLHCLPRHKEEVSDEVFYSDASLVFPEAENRMWTVMAVMASQLGKY